MLRAEAKDNERQNRSTKWCFVMEQSAMKNKSGTRNAPAATSIGTCYGAVLEFIKCNQITRKSCNLSRSLLPFRSHASASPRSGKKKNYRMALLMERSWRKTNRETENEWRAETKKKKKKTAKLLTGLMEYTSARHESPRACVPMIVSCSLSQCRPA